MAFKNRKKKPSGYAVAAAAAQERTSPEGQEKAQKKKKERKAPELSEHTRATLFERGRSLATTIKELLVRETAAHAEHQRLIKERKERTKELVALWEDAEQGQDHLPLRDDTPAEGEDEESGSEEKPEPPRTFVDEHKASYNGCALRVWREHVKDPYRATVDGNGGGEHKTLGAAQLWCLEWARQQAGMTELDARALKRERDLLSWTKTNPFRAVPAVDPSGKEWAFQRGKDTATLKESEPGKWTGRLNGKPLAIDLGFEQARQLVEKELGGPVDWTVTEDFLPPTGEAAAE